MTEPYRDPLAAAGERIRALEEELRAARVPASRALASRIHALEEERAQLVASADEPLPRPTKAGGVLLLLVLQVVSVWAFLQTNDLMARILVTVPFALLGAFIVWVFWRQKRIRSNALKPRLLALETRLEDLRLLARGSTTNVRVVSSAASCEYQPETSEDVLSGAEVLPRHIDKS